MEHLLEYPLLPEPCRPCATACVAVAGKSEATEIERRSVQSVDECISLQLPGSSLPADACEVFPAGPVMGRQPKPRAEIDSSTGNKPASNGFPSLGWS